MKAGESFGEIESVKAVSDLYSPVDGEVVEVNTPLANKLETLNADPYGAGWIAKIKIGDESGLKNLLDYECISEEVCGRSTLEIRRSKIEVRMNRSSKFEQLFDELFRLSLF